MKVIVTSIMGLKGAELIYLTCAAGVCCGPQMGGWYLRMTWGQEVCYTSLHSEPASALSLPTVWSLWGNPGMARCWEMATLPAGYIPQRKVPSASSSGSLGFIVCVQCCRMVDSVIHALYFIYLHSILFFNFSGWKFFRSAHDSRVLQNSAHKTSQFHLMTTSKRLWPHYERLRSRVAIGDQKDSLDYHQQCLATTFRRGSKESSSSCFAPWGSILDLRSWRQASQQWVGVPKYLENWVVRKLSRKTNF